MKKVTKTATSSSKKPSFTQKYRTSKTVFPRLMIINQGSLDEALVQQIEKSGYEVMSLSFPDKVVSIASQALGDIFSEIAVYEWIIFANVEAVKTFFQSFFERYRDIRSIGPMRFVSLSKEATDVIKQYHFEVEFEGTDKANTIEQVLADTSLENEKVLVIGPGSTVEPIAQYLESQARAIVDRYPYEQRELLGGLNLELIEQFQKVGAHYILFSSPESVDVFMQHARLLALKPTAQKPRTISLNLQTTQRLRQHQIPVDIELIAELSNALVPRLEKLLSQKF